MFRWFREKKNSENGNLLENNFEFQFLFQDMELKHDCTYKYPPIGASFPFQYC